MCHFVQKLIRNFSGSHCKQSTFAKKKFWFFLDFKYVQLEDFMNFNNRLLICGGQLYWSTIIFYTQFRCLQPTSRFIGCQFGSLFQKQILMLHDCFKKQDLNSSNKKAIFWNFILIFLHWHYEKIWSKKIDF